MNPVGIGKLRLLGAACPFDVSSLFVGECSADKLASAPTPWQHPVADVRMFRTILISGHIIIIIIMIIIIGRRHRQLQSK